MADQTKNILVQVEVDASKAEAGTSKARAALASVGEGFASAGEHISGGDEHGVMTDTGPHPGPPLPACRSRAGMIRSINTQSIPLQENSIPDARHLK